MTWVKIDDCATLHPKLLAVGAAGVGLWLAGLCHSNRLASDGAIAKKSLTALYPSDTAWSKREANRAAAKLVQAGLWIDDGDVWRIHDYADYQREATSEVVQKRRAADAERKAKQRSLSAKPKDEPKVEQRWTEGTPKVAQLDPSNTNDLPRLSDAPVPARPDPERKKEEEREVAALPPAPPAVKPKKPKKPKKRDQDKELMRKVLLEVGSTFSLLRFCVPEKFEAKVLAKAQDYAAIEAMTLAEAVRQIASEGIQRQLDAGKDPEWGPVNWQPSRALRSVKRGIAPCAPASAFHQVDPNEFCEAMGW